MPRQRIIRLARALITAQGLFAFGAAHAVNDAVSSANALVPEQACENGACTLTYEPAFFARYAPVTAFDMLDNVPGFDVDDGDSDTRGFGGAAGNVVVDGARISSKSESTSDVLRRIPASNVARIEIIRGQVGGLDLRGQNVVANVIRSRNSGSGAWSVNASTLEPGGGFYPAADLSYTLSSDRGEVTLGLYGSEGRFSQRRRERVFDGAGALTEDRQERFDREDEDLGGSLNASAQLGAWVMNANVGMSRFESDGGELSRRSPGAAGSAPVALFQGEVEDASRKEIGLDGERALGDDWKLKLIGLYREEDFSNEGSLVRGPIDSPGVVETTTTSSSISEERIGRLELDFGGVEGHTLEFSAELSENTLASDFSLRALENGVLVNQPVPGADTEVEERRLDLLLSDSFRIGGVSIDAAIGAEDSRIEQAGGFEDARELFFWKPSLTMSYAPTARRQWRMRAVRDVGQLDLENFASGADLGDVELALGNPELAPETTTTVDLSYEVRGTGIGIGSVTLFHDWVEDVNDQLPLTGNLEVPGNIGSATRMGVEASLTLPLDRIGIRGGRLDWQGRWQTSSVDDPLNGSVRALSGERRWTTVAEFRQDLPDRKVAWGFVTFSRDRFPQFGLDEVEDRGRRVDMDLFVESRALPGLIVTLFLEDVFRDGDDRDRRVFAGPRDVSPLAFRERREQSRSTTVSLEVRGNI
ncbi:MAG: TonB-dependent receptor [Pseudomonadota bacterium]|nr:TonB-dependent receptor [Pseudomonadota bacterium]